MDGWYYVESGRAVGPLSRIELEACVQAGRVTPDTLVCEDGESEWRLARRVRGLVPPRVLKAWQVSVTASRRIDPPPALPFPAKPVRLAPAMSPSAPAAGEQPSRTSPALASGAPAQPGGGPTAWRRPLGLLLAVAATALLGGSIGAVLVLRMAARPPDSPAPSVPLTTPGESAFAPPPSEGGSEGLRPELPPAPAGLPPAASSLLEARRTGLQRDWDAHRALAEQFLAAGGLDASTLPSREAVQARLEALGDVRASNESLRRRLSALPDDVRTAGLDGGLASELADVAARRARADLAPLAAELEDEAEMQDVAGQALGLLETTHGLWTVGGKRLAFAAAAGADAPERYERLLEDARAIASR